MFKKLMAMIKSPKKHGEIPSDIGGHRWLKTYDVVLTNMEGSPAYPLSHQLSIGSELGNIIINDPSVSPRHATILLQEEVISIMDHGSVAGTFVNGTKIPAGKFIILEETDKINVGDLEVEIDVKTRSVDNTGFIPPGHEHLEDEETEEEEVEEESEEESEEDEEESESTTSITKSKIYAGNPKAKSPPKIPAKNYKKKKKFSLSLPSYDAANSLIRVMAVSADLLVSYLILVVFLPFDDFRSFIDFVPSFISEALDIQWAHLWQIATEESGQVTELAKELYLMLNEVVPVLRLLVIFLLVRLVTTIIFGVSFSEFMFGMRANFNMIWARIGGVLRVIIGMITWPFLIFDIPSLASKRTFKEFITFTNTFVGSRVTLFFGIVFYFPLLLLLLLLSPMFIGLELVEPIPFTANVSQRVKVKQPVEGVVEQKVSEGSRYLGFALTYDPQMLSIIPSFRFKGEKAKLNMQAETEIFLREGERTVSLELFKTFDMKELLMIGLRGNYFLQDKYQTIYNFAFAADNTKRTFKIPQNVKQEEMFGKQVIDFTGMAFGLGIDTLPDFMTTTTPLLKSVVEYRSSLLGLFEYKDFTDISVAKIGKILCLRFTYDKQRPFDLIMPIMKGEGRIFKVTYDSKQDLVQLRNKFYKFSLDEIVWGIPSERENVETYKGLEVIDLFTTNLEKSLITPEKAQALYGYYFEKSADVLKRGQMIEYEIWKGSVKSVMNVISYLREPEATDVVPQEGSPTPAGEVKAKLQSNFTDLYNALENKNKSFFGIEEVPAV